MSVKRLAIIAMLTAMAIVLSILESFIPMFIPGVKLGLANVIILIMLYEFKISEALIVDILRILVVAILRSTLLSPTFIMSLSGGVLSFVIMLIFSRIKVFSIIGVSVLGSISHCFGQIIAAMLLLSSEAVVYYLPFIAILSCATGVLCGLITKLYLKRSITSKFIEE
ncbi:MAG: Gx transporter family protein [Erysipelotrichaceae bacterium]|nr:Gx transporter family protein [Erysipelotrichaceae bacterium]